MGSYDDRVYDAKQAVTRTLCDLGKPDTRLAVMDLAGQIDALNRAWDDLTNCLVRQRRERDEQIIRLINELAEAKRERTT